MDFIVATQISTFGTTGKNWHIPQNIYNEFGGFSDCRHVGEMLNLSFVFAVAQGTLLYGNQLIFVQKKPTLIITTAILCNDISQRIGISPSHGHALSCKNLVN